MKLFSFIIFFLFFSDIFNKDQPSSNLKSDEKKLLVFSNFVVSSQNSTFILSDDYHCNAKIIDIMDYEFTNGDFSILTRKISLKPNIKDYRNFIVTSEYFFNSNIYISRII